MTTTLEPVPAGPMRVFASLIELHRIGYRLTIRGVMMWAGLKSPNGVRVHLLKLRDMGLIDYEDNRHGTIRLTCTVGLYPEAFNDHTINEEYVP